MITLELELIDQTIQLIRAKKDEQSFLSQTSLHKFEFCFFLCLDIVRFELQTTEKISDLTADALGQLFAFGTFEYYYRDFPEVYDKCSELFNRLIEFNEQLKNHDLPGNIGLKDKLWIDYFNKKIASLILSNPPNY